MADHLPATDLLLGAIHLLRKGFSRLAVRVGCRLEHRLKLATSGARQLQPLFAGLPLRPLSSARKPGGGVKATVTQSQDSSNANATLHALTIVSLASLLRQPLRPGFVRSRYLGVGSAQTALPTCRTLLDRNDTRCGQAHHPWRQHHYAFVRS